MNRFAFSLLFSLLHGSSLYSQNLQTESEIITSIQIEVSAAEIWEKLIDFQSYPKWHTYLLEVKGEPVTKSKIRCLAQNSDRSTEKFSAFLQEIELNKKLAWGGNLGFLFRAQHYFILESISENQTRLIQGEYWKGWFGKMYGKKIYAETYLKFEIMNQRLKEILEE